jgi:hypothetical protein
MSVEELYGRVWRELAMKEGHRPRLPEFTGRTITYEKVPRGQKIRDAVSDKYRAVSHMTPEEVAAHLGVSVATVQRAGRQYKIAFGAGK